MISTSFNAEYDSRIDLAIMKIRGSTKVLVEKGMEMSFEELASGYVTVLEDFKPVQYILIHQKIDLRPYSKLPLIFEDLAMVKYIVEKRSNQSLQEKVAHIIQPIAAIADALDSFLTPLGFPKIFGLIVKAFIGVVNLIGDKREEKIKKALSDSPYKLEEDVIEYLEMDTSSSTKSVPQIPSCANTPIVMVRFNHIAGQRDFIDNLVPGLLMAANFSIQNTQHHTFSLTAHISIINGSNSKALIDKEKTVSIIFCPNNEQETYQLQDLPVFVPYAELNLDAETHDLRFYLEIFDNTAKREVESSDFNYFR